jgi:hypothetical protein
LWIITFILSWGRHTQNNITLTSSPFIKKVGEQILGILIIIQLKTIISLCNLKGKHELRVVEGNVLRKMFTPKKVEVVLTGRFKMLYNE